MGLFTSQNVVRLRGFARPSETARHRARNLNILEEKAIEYNMRSIFLEKSYTKCAGETIPRPFFKTSKLSISLDQQPKFSYSLL